MRLLLFFMCIIAPLQFCWAQITFIDVSTQLGIVHTFGNGEFGGGVSFADFNNDGWDDLSLASESGASLQFFQNNGGSFTLVTPSFVNFTGESKQILWADFDRDGDNDLFVAGYMAPSRLYRNDGNMQFTDISDQAGFFPEPVPSFGAAWGDYDLDGWLDLFVLNRSSLHPNFLYRNAGDGTFEWKGPFAGVEETSKNPFCASFIDYNFDGWQDIYIAVDHGQGNTLFKNNTDGTFTDVSELTSSGLVMNAMCVAAGDFDNDLDLDIYISNTEEGNKLLRSDPENIYSEIAAGSGVGFYGTGWGSNWLDFDNDGDLDLYVCGSDFGSAADANHSALYENSGNSTFSKTIGSGFAGDTTRSYSNAIGDMNQDGFPEIAVNNESPDYFQLWKGNSNENNWLRIRLKGVISNPHGIGSSIYVSAGGETQMRYIQAGVGYLGQNSFTEIIGLGSNLNVDSIKVVWLSGETDFYQNLAANQTLVLVEGNPITQSENLSSGDLQVYPNPFKDYLILNSGMLSAHPTRIALFHANGQMALERTDFTVNDDPFRIDTQRLQAGIYFFLWESNEGRIWKKVVKTE